MTEKPPRILIIDDDELLSLVVSQALHGEGFETVTADDGLAGLKLITNERFDAIITDVHMPQINGVELVSMIKASALNKATPIVVISGNFSDGIAAKLQALGLVDVVPKPFELKALRALMKSRLIGAHKKVAYAPFVVSALRDAAKEALAAVGAKTAVIGEPFIQKSRQLPGEISGQIALFGHRAHGSVGVSCERSFALNLASTIFADSGSGTKKDERIESSFSAAVTGELATKVAAKFRDHLYKDRLFVVPGLVMVIEAENFTAAPMVASPKICLPVTVSKGPGEPAKAWIELALADLHEHLPKEEESAASFFVYADTTPKA